MSRAVSSTSIGYVNYHGIRSRHSASLACGARSRSRLFNHARAVVASPSAVLRKALRHLNEGEIDLQVGVGEDDCAMSRLHHTPRAPARRCSHQHLRTRVRRNFEAACETSARRIASVTSPIQPHAHPVRAFLGRTGAALAASRSMRVWLASASSWSGESSARRARAPSTPAPYIAPLSR